MVRVRVGDLSADMSDDSDWPTQRLYDVQHVEVMVVTFKFGPPFFSLSHTPEFNNLWASCRMRSVETDTGVFIT